jgi:hypothetical protein
MEVAIGLMNLYKAVHPFLREQRRPTSPDSRKPHPEHPGFGQNEGNEETPVVQLGIRPLPM